jgi:predicted nuclease of restriction endonuclease-like (RecB) superfamily
MPQKPARREEALFRRVAEIMESARGQVARTENSAMVHAYWLIGREIVEVEQQGKKRAGYGEQVIQGLAERLTALFGAGYSIRNLRRIRQFYLTFPSGSVVPAELGGPEKRPAALAESTVRRPGKKRPAALAESTVRRPGKKRPTVLAESRPVGAVMFPPSLSWAHYAFLLKVESSNARAFYEIEALREAWSARELERQIASLLFERLAKSRDKDKVLALAKKGHEVTVPRDVIKDSFVLEFLDLPERRAWLERDLEQAIIDRIEDFLLELGKGFCFVARQRRITLEGDHFYVDLVFYNRLLRCFVLIDLKLGKLTHQDLGQMQMYVNFFDRFQRAEHEQPTVGIVLCSEKNDAVVKITLPEENKQILAARYQHYLPTEEALRSEVTRTRDAVEHRIILEADGPRPSPQPKHRARPTKGKR